MHFPWGTFLLTLYHYRLTRLYGLTSPFLLLWIWKLLPSLFQRLPSPSKERAWGHSTWRRGCGVNWWVKMTHRFRWILRSSCLPYTPWLMLSTTHGGMAFPMPGGSLMDWIMRNSTSPALRLPLLLKNMLNLFFFFSFSFTLFVMASNNGKL